VELLAAQVVAAPRLPGRAVLLELLAEVGEGVQSHLESLGLRMLLSVPGLPRPQLQYRLVLPGGPVHVDAAWPEVRSAVEFDGAAFHSDPEARLRDLRRDAALAASGWVVLRFSYVDVTERPGVCGAQVAAVHRTRLDEGPGAGIPGIRMPAPGTAF
jgi:hypothetical protein